MKIIKQSLLLSTSLLLFSCASILNGKKQSVYLNTNSQNAKVFIDNKEVGKGASIKTKLTRDLKIKQIRIEEEGYKDEFKVVAQTHRSPWYIMSVCSAVAAVTYWVPFVDNGKKAFNYDKKIDISTKKTKIYKRANDQKYVHLESTAFDVKKEDLKYKSIKRKNFNKNNEKYTHVETSTENLNFDNSIFSDALDEILVKYNYADTTGVLLKNNSNYLHIKSTIKKIDFQYITDRLGIYPLNYIVTNTEIEWEILDIYNQSKFKTTTKTQSGEFSFDFKDENTEKKKTPVLLSTEDAITKSFFDFLGQKEVAELMKAKGEDVKKQDVLTLKKPEAINSVEDALSATVTVKNSKGHGSGCIISNDGYIVTNFHVVALEKKQLTVIDHSGKEFKATLVRKNEQNDLALLKVEGTFSKAFTLPKDKSYKIGDDVFVIGTPRSIELGQSLSKGIISGLRSSQGVNYIQTDASVNGGNSGGSIVSKSGSFLGVVNSKIFGTGVEGLGFGCPAEEIFESLQIVQ